MNVACTPTGRSPLTWRRRPLLVETHELGMTELHPADGATAIDEEEPWSYRRKLILAPMVRINSLAFRDLCAEYGCKMLYSEEIVARNLVQSKRMNNEALGTIDFIEPDLGPSKPGGRVCFRTRPGENVVLQLGTACATEALQAANHVADCVKAVDLNMGCPVKFSVQGGMGSALLTEPEKVRDILTTLRRNLPASLPVTCKIRLLEDFKDTLQLAQLIESCGVQALAVHARRKHHRPRHWAQWDQFRLLKDALPSTLPVVLNGDVFTPSDIPRALSFTGADSLMLARGALWNPSIFAVRYPPVCAPYGAETAEPREAAAAAAELAKEAKVAATFAGPEGASADGSGMVTQAEVVARFIELCEQQRTPVGNAKYTALLMLEGAGKTEPFQMLQRAKTQADLNAAALACRSHPHFARPGGTFVPASLEPPPDIPDAPSLPVNAWRHIPRGWKPGAEPVRRAKAPLNRASPVLDEKRAAAAAKKIAAAEDAAVPPPTAAAEQPLAAAAEQPVVSSGDKRSFDQI